MIHLTACNSSLPIVCTLLDETSTRLTKFKDFQMIVNQISRIDKRGKV